MMADDSYSTCANICIVLTLTARSESNYLMCKGEELHGMYVHTYIQYMHTTRSRLEQHVCLHLCAHGKTVQVHILSAYIYVGN